MMQRRTEYTVFLLPDANKELEGLPEEVRTNVEEQLRLLVHPYQVDSKKLKGAENTYRMRVGKYRILYRVYDDDVIVIIIRIAHRSKVYRKI